MGHDSVLIILTEMSRLHVNSTSVKAPADGHLLLMRVFLLALSLQFNC